MDPKALFTKSKLKIVRKSSKIRVKIVKKSYLSPQPVSN